MLRKFISLIILALSSCSMAIAGKDTFSVFFRSNESILTEGIQRQLDNALYSGRLSDKDAIALIGYTDEIGGEKANMRLSIARAKTVKKYLIQSGFRPDHITIVEGKGKFGARPGADGEGFPRDRRVDIVPVEATAEVVAPTTQPAAPPATPAPASAPLIDVSKLVVGESMTLEKIYFEDGTHQFKQASYATLDALVRSLKQNAYVRIRIEGHVCCTKGSEEGLDEETHKYELSVTRALAVRNYLIKKGISPNRLEYEGKARKEPVFTEEHTDEEARANRRVEIRIL
jgi:outer membrane protein OmpA-like peptidoglycan-associated protein